MSASTRWSATATACCFLGDLSVLDDDLKELMPGNG